MKNFLVYLILVFSGLSLAVFWRNQRDPQRDNRPVVRVYGASSFIKSWGPGPVLKQIFEKSCDCRIDFIEAVDTTMLIQKLKIEGRSAGADLVLGFDQYDLEMAQKGFEWRTLKFDEFDFEDSIRGTLSRQYFIPYDWGVLSFIGRKSKIKEAPISLDDLLKPEFSGQISMQDPRTSTPGLQFLIWLIQVKGEDQAFQYLQKFNTQVKAFGASWSSSWGLFQKQQVNVTFSYLTSVVATQIEDKDHDVIPLEFSEGHPVQYEYLAIPNTCRNCELADKFVNLIFSPEGQKIIMEKNYMFPVIKGVRAGTAFATLPQFKILDMNVIPTFSERERLLKRWAQLRRSE